MAVDVVSVPRESAANYLDGVIRELQRDDPLAPVTVVAPSALAATRLPRALIRLRSERTDGPVGFANIAFVTLARLAETLGAERLERTGRRRLTRTALGAAVRAALGASGHAFGLSAVHPGTASEVTERYEELRFAGVLGETASPALSWRARELAAICARIRSAIEATTYDDVDLIRSAISRLEAGVGADLGALLVYLPERARPIEVALLRALGAAGRVRVIIGSTDEVETDPGAEEPGTAMLRELGTLLGVEPSTVASRTRGPLVLDQLVRAPSPRAEVRAACRLVLEALERGTEPERIALVYANREPYLRLLTGELREAGIVYSGPTTEPLASEAPGRLLLALLELRGPRMRREALATFLRSAPMLDARGIAVPVAEWDRLTRLIGLVEAPLGEWRARLADFLPEPESEGLGRPREARAAASLDEFLGSVDELLQQLEAAHGWNELAGWGVSVLGRLTGDGATRSDWPPGAVAAFDVSVALLEELATLDHLEPGVHSGELAALLAEELRRPGPRVGRRSSGVIVGALDQPTGCELDLAVVLGASAANLPAGSPRSPLLEVADREMLGLEARSPRASSSRARRQLGLLRRSAVALVATAPVLDASGRQMVTSRFVSGAAATISLAGELGSLAAVRDGAVARTSTELETALLFDVEVDSAPSVAASLGLGDLAHRLDIVAVRDRGVFGPYSGSIGAGNARISATPYSPTSLETIATCPFQHFLDHVVDCEVLDEPERRVEIDPRNRGRIVHEVLERFVAASIEDPTLGGGDPAEVLRATAESVMARFARAGLTGKRLVFELERRRILEAVELERRLDVQRLIQRRSRPVVVEHGFGFGEVAPVEVRLEDRSIFFRGLVDRIDVAEDGSIDVIDYKTGRSDSFGGISHDPIDGGRHLQLPIYALAARSLLDAEKAPVRAVFRFVGAVPDEIGIALDDATEQRLRTALTVLSDTVEGGVLPMRPGPSDFGGPANCRWCDFNSVCPPERQRFFEGAQKTGLLDRYLELTDGTAGFGEDLIGGESCVALTEEPVDG